MNNNSLRYTDEELEEFVGSNRKALEDRSVQLSDEIGPMYNLNKDAATNAVHKMYNALEELFELRQQVKQHNADMRDAMRDASRAYREGYDDGCYASAGY